MNKNTLKPFDLLTILPKSENLVEYCSLFSTQESKLPNYLVPFKEFIDNVLDIPEETMKNIEKTVIENEKAERKKESTQNREKKITEENERKITDALNSQVTKIMKKPIAFVKRTCPVKIKYKSTLLHDDHEFFIRSSIKFQIRDPITQQEHEEFAKYEKMKEVVVAEQTCMMNFSFQVSNLVLEIYNSILPPVGNYVQSYVEARCQKALDYPQFYRSELQIPLKHIDSQLSRRTYSLIHQSHLLSTGFVPRIIIPNTFHRTFFPQDESVAAKVPPHIKRLSIKISEDKNAEMLAIKQDVKVVMTASAFKKLVDNNEDDTEKNWNLPVLIKSLQSKDTSGSSKSTRICYIDKPLVQKSWYPLDIKKKFFRKAADAQLIKLDNYNSFEMKSPLTFCDTSHQREPLSNVYEDDPFGEAAEGYCLDIESFGDSLSPTKKLPPRTQMPGSSEDSTKKSRDNKTGKIPSNDQKNKKTETDSSKEMTTLENEPPKKYISPLVRSALQSQEKRNSRPHLKPWSNPEKINWTPEDKIEKIGFRDGCNYHYELILLTTEKEGSSEEDREDPLRILVRHRIHGLSKFRGKPNISKAFIVDMKVENQVYFGAEVHTKSEIAQQWASLLVRPNTYMLHFRTCVESGSVVLMEEKSLDSVLIEGQQPHIDFNPNVVASSLNTVFTSILRMPTGQYMLHRNCNTNANIQLLKATLNESEQHLCNLDLHQIYGDKVMAPRAYKTVPWLAIDTEVLTPFHTIHGKIPSTFPMENVKKLDRKTRKMKRRAAEQKKSIDDPVPRTEEEASSSSAKRGPDGYEAQSKSRRKYF